jgi:hypothetical protein
MAKIPVSFRWEAEILATAKRRAVEERRPLTGYLEWLIAEDAKKHPAPERSSAPRRARKKAAP